MSRLVYDLIKAPPESLGCSSTEKYVLLSYVDALNPPENGTLAWPGRETIARHTGFNEKTVRRAIERLCDLELIKLHRRTPRMKIYSVNVGLINRLIVSGHGVHSDGGQKVHSPDERVDTESKVIGHGVQSEWTQSPLHRTTNRTTNTTTKISPVGGSATLKVSHDPVQRKLAVHAIVAGTAERLRADRREPPTKKKTAVLPDLPAGMRSVRERPG